jgi:rubrerythrin
MTNRGEEVESVLAALKQGIELESFGIKFYTESAGEVTDPRGRQTLKFLANEEREHLKFIKDLKSSFENREEEKANTTIKTWKEKSHQRVFPEIEAYLEEVQDSRGDIKILEAAEEIETRSIEFYKGALDEVENKDSKDIFNILIKEEVGHLALVQQMNDYMTLHGVWSGLEDYFANE